MKRSILTFLLSLVTVTSAHAQAEMGYAQSQDSAIQTFERFLTEVSSGTISQKTSLSDKELHYLSGVYLFCTLKNGTCPVLLSSILELDIVASQMEGKASCPNMLRFWKTWVDNGLEQRVDYSLSTGFITKYFDFKRDVRPDYLKCSGTVEKELMSEMSLKEFLKSRYEPQSTELKNLQTFTGYLKAIKEQVADVFVATGAYRRESAPTSGKK